MMQRVKDRAGENLSAWVLGLISRELHEPTEEEDQLVRVLKRLDKLEDFEQFIRGRIAKTEAPLRQAVVKPPAPFKEPAPLRELRVVPDGQ